MVVYISILPLALGDAFVVTSCCTSRNSNFKLRYFEVFLVGGRTFSSCGVVLTVRTRSFEIMWFSFGHEYITDKVNH